MPMRAEIQKPSFRQKTSNALANLSMLIQNLPTFAPNRFKHAFAICYPGVSIYLTGVNCVVNKSVQFFRPHVAGGVCPGMGAFSLLLGGVVTTKGVPTCTE